MITIQMLEQFPGDTWNQFVEQHPGGTCFHLSEWAQISQALYGWRPYYLYATRDNAICGVLPLVQVTGLAGNALVSTPFCVYGGVVSDDEETRIALEERATSLAGDLGVSYLEMRQRENTNPVWSSTDLYATFRKSLAPDLDANRAAVPRKQRAMIRKGEKAGLVARTNGDLATFYDLFALSVRNLGTPVYSKKLFEVLVDVFRQRVEISIIEHEGSAVCSVLSLYFRDEVLPYYAGGTPQARAVAGYDYMYWNLIERAVEKNCAVFDFGRSMRGSGAFSFKKNWGFEPAPLNYQYLLLGRRHVPVKDPNQWIYKTLTGAWRRLPLSVANRLGPVIAKSLY